MEDNIFCLKSIPENDYEKACFFQDTLIGMATSDTSGGTHEDYVIMRKYFMEKMSTRELLPEWIIKSRNQSQFWSFIKSKFGSYQERRQFIWSETDALINECERTQLAPSREVSKVLLSIDEKGISDYWHKALERKTTDPEGAITMSRTLLEGVCKYILKKRNVTFNEKNAELSELYKQTAEELNLSSSQHTEKIFKQILGGCSGIVNGLGSLRNKMGDAHGHSDIVRKPAERHAELSVNLAGAMATFLLQTMEKRDDKKNI